MYRRIRALSSLRSVWRQNAGLEVPAMLWTQVVGDFRA